MTEVSETRATDWIAFGHHGFAAYRIWERKTAFSMYQRHEWRMDNGSIQMDDWIAVPARADFGKTMKPIAADELAA
jgi:hypothetical protein